jgi:ribonuclease I
MVALWWQPQWSLPPYCYDELVAHMTPTSYASTRLTIHGLWPNYDPSLHNGMSWPQYCTRPDGENYTACEASYSLDYCYPAAAADKFNNTDHWQHYALEYSWSDLASHEWSKHGSCTNWTNTE